MNKACSKVRFSRLTKHSSFVTSLVCQPVLHYCPVKCLYIHLLQIRFDLLLATNTLRDCFQYKYFIRKLFIALAMQLVLLYCIHDIPHTSHLYSSHRNNVKMLINIGRKRHGRKKSISSGRHCVFVNKNIYLMKETG